ncbi:MAG: hypothetical protein ABIE74_09550 [Pseudomonadota bacterium]
MKSLKTKLFILSILFLLPSCKSTTSGSINEQSRSWSINQLVNEAKSLATKANQTDKRSEKMDITKEGIAIALRCVMNAPEEPGCYYWHAVNTGLYYEAKVIGYQKGIKEMIADCNKVIDLDERYDYGGAYRILGELFTKLPRTALNADDIVRDLSKAEKYLRESVRIAADYPENHLLLSENLLAQGKIREALEALTSAQTLTPAWRNNSSYIFWLSKEKKLRTKLADR